MFVYLCISKLKYLTEPFYAAQEKRMLWKDIHLQQVKSHLIDHEWIGTTRTDREKSVLKGLYAIAGCELREHEDDDNGSNDSNVRSMRKKLGVCFDSLPSTFYSRANSFSNNRTKPIRLGSSLRNLAVQYRHKEPKAIAGSFCLRRSI
jgi:hypothetical protein